MSYQRRDAYNRIRTNLCRLRLSNIGDPFFHCCHAVHLQNCQTKSTQQPVGSLRTSMSMVVQCDHFPLQPSISSSMTSPCGFKLSVGCASELEYEAQWFGCDVEHSSRAVCTVTSNPSWLEGMCTTEERLVFDTNWELLRRFSEFCAL